MLRNLTLAFPLLSILTDRASAASFRARSSRSPHRHPAELSVLSFSPTPTRLSRPTPPRPVFHFPPPPRSALTVLPPFGPTQALFWSSPVQNRSSLFHHHASFLFSVPRRDHPILRNFNTQHTSARAQCSFLPHVNPTRWNLLPQCPPPLSSTCQVDMSSSRAPPEVCSLPFLSTWIC